MKRVHDVLYGLAGLPQNGIGLPSLGTGIVLAQFVHMSAVFQPRAGCAVLEPHHLFNCTYIRHLELEMSSGGCSV